MENLGKHICIVGITLYYLPGANVSIRNDYIKYYYFISHITNALFSYGYCGH